MRGARGDPTVGNHNKLQLFPKHFFSHSDTKSLSIENHRIWPNSKDFSFLSRYNTWNGTRSKKRNVDMVFQPSNISWILQYEIITSFSSILIPQKYHRS